MPFQKGNKLGGRKEGAINKVNKDTKEAIKMLIEKNLDNLSIWLNKIATKNPEKAMYIIINLLEYIIPKLSRQDNISSDGSMTPKISIRPIDWVDTNAKDK